MSWKETSKRDCREDPECKKLVKYSWKWSATNDRLIRELKRIGTPKTLAIAEEREKFFVDVPRSASRSNNK